MHSCEWANKFSGHLKNKDIAHRHFPVIQYRTWCLVFLCDTVNCTCFLTLTWGGSHIPSFLPQIQVALICPTCIPGGHNGLTHLQISIRFRGKEFPQT